MSKTGIPTRHFSQSSKLKETGGKVQSDMKQGDWTWNPQLQETNGECVVFLKRRDLTGDSVRQGSDNYISNRFLPTA